jgi:3-methyladenine DNA glycosylase AlkC
MEVPYYVSVHFVRHHIGVNHYVSTQRDDRVFRDEEITRADLPQGQIVSHIMSVNAQELMFMSRRRMRMQADPFTRAVMQEIVKQITETNPEFNNTCEPMCFYRGGRCTEFNCCGLNKTYKDGGEVDE